MLAEHGVTFESRKASLFLQDFYAVPPVLDCNYCESLIVFSQSAHLGLLIMLLLISFRFTISLQSVACLNVLSNKSMPTRSKRKFSGRALTAACPLLTVTEESISTFVEMKK